MRFWLLILLKLFLSCVLTNGQYRVNEGASTSTGSSASADSLTDEERCEIDEIADDRIDLVTGRYVNFDGDLRTVIPGRFDEIQALLLVMRSYNLRVVQGKGSGRLPNWEARLKYFSERLAVRMEEIFKLCYSPTHYQREVEYSIDGANKTVIFYRDCKPSHSRHQCLCDTASNERYFDKCINRRVYKKCRERLMAVEKEPKRPDKIIKFEEPTSTVEPREGPPLSQHHIIPHSLIQEFYYFDRIKSKSNNYQCVSNRCMQTLILRMKNIAKMWLFVNLWNEKKFLPEINAEFERIDLERLVEDDYFEAISQRHWSWSGSGGNLFVGPDSTARGPFDPSNWRAEYGGFEHDCEPIIGSERYRVALTAYNTFKKSIESSKKMNEMQKIMEFGSVVHIYSDLLNNYEIVPFNPDQWEYREPTEEELSRIRKPMQKKYRNKKFWAIKKPAPESDGSKKTKRSIANDKSLFKIDDFVKQRLMDFVLVSLRDQNEADSRKESLAWSSDFNNLFNEYLQGNWTNVVCQNSTQGFDHFLYSKMFPQKRWFECVAHSEEIENDIYKEWCFALRRIVFESDSDSWQYESSRPLQFLKDRTTIWKELNRIPDTSMTNIDDDNIEYNKRINIHSYNGVNFLSSIILSYFKSGLCIGNSVIRVKRDVNFTGEFYETE